MDRHRRRMLLALGLAPFAAPTAVFAQAAPGGYLELNPPLPVETRGKIEVIEFFWYGCPHCYDFEPLIEPWAGKLSSDVQFRRIPAVFNNPQWMFDARIFYAFEALGLVEKLHRPLFDAIHRDRLRTTNAESGPQLQMSAPMGEWLRKHDVDPKKFDEVMKSFTVQSKTRRSAQLSLAYRITGTPAMAVQGRYTINLGDDVPTFAAMLKTADYLIAVVRKGMAAKS